ncbi:HD-GYP domain-containing protein [Simplicispira psychrophila]|uniref:HD-GYP domain-containing protein n=1 Tax=Simplicispira psychrophila TaxID=80882 RepID=UPI000481D461|nr:HD domain-containing phosphohydrolase [Simplicispira psychrophila]
MKLIALNIESIQLGQPLPFALRAASGALLARRGYVIRSRSELDSLITRGVELCIDTTESGDSHRHYLARLQGLLLSDKSLGHIASVKLAAAGQSPRGSALGAALDWTGQQTRATQLLRSPQSADFSSRFWALHEDLVQSSQQVPDATLLALVHISAQETRMYSATHSMLVACVCMIVARSTLRWPEAQVRRVGCAALGMNLAMTELQDQLALQTEPLDAGQIAAVESHALRSADLLQQMGFDDPVVLEAVRHHHHRAPGSLANKTETQQVARLLQRADIFAARLAPRAARTPMPVTAAMQACYYDEEQQVDEAGVAIVKTLGVYPPGAFVRLTSQEVGLVFKRGSTATTPRVAVLLNRDDMPTGEMIPRDTALPAWKITGAVAQRDVRVSISLERLLALV